MNRPCVSRRVVQKPSLNLGSTRARLTAAYRYMTEQAISTQGEQVIGHGVWRHMRGSIGALALAALALAASHLAVPPSAAFADGPPTRSASNRPACQYAHTQRVTQVREPGIREASALVASQQYPGIYWTLNDSKNTPFIFAFDDQGTPRGAFRVTGATNVDWEAMQLGPDGNGGFALYIGDIGDNDALRRDPVIYRVPEPEPTEPGAPTAGETAPVEAFRFEFPGMPHNAEAMLVHPKTGEVTLLTKEVSGLSLIYRLPLPLDSGNLMMADMVNVVDLRAFDPASAMVTDAAISADGQHIALRTYASALIWDVQADVPADRLWEQAPAVYPLTDGPKGEGLAFRADSDDLMTVGEEVPAALYDTAWQC
jgi:hypothetical protein